MIERTKHEIQTPYGVVLLTLLNKTRDGDHRVEFATPEEAPLVLPFRQRRLALAPLVLLRSKYNAPDVAWETSMARGLHSRFYLNEGEGQTSQPAPSDPKVSKVTAYLKGLLQTWMAAHPIEVQEALTQNAQEDLWEAQEAVEFAEEQLAKAKSSALAATALLGRAERELDSLRQLPPINALRPFVAPALLKPEAASPSTHSRGFAAGEGRE